jgi:hypothetical protein
MPTRREPVWLTRNYRHDKAFFCRKAKESAMNHDKSKTDTGVQGEGDYKSARVYKQDVEGFIQRKDRDIPKMAQDAEKAVEGPEGAELAKAEEKGKSKARH